MVQFDLTTTGTSANLGRKAAIDVISIIEGNWNGGQVMTQQRTTIKKIQLKARRGIGGQIRGPANVQSALIENFQSGDILSDFTQINDMRSGNLGQIIESRFCIIGDVLQRFTTRSQPNSLRDPNGLDDNVLDLLSPGSGLTGVVQIDNLTDASRVRTA